METSPPQGLDVKQIADLVFRNKALIITCLLLAISAGLAYYLIQPKTYQGTALLSYQQQRINPAQMSPDEQENIRDIVSTLTDIVTSRTNLEKIITNEGLYPDLQKKVPMEDVILSMRKQITTETPRRGDTFTVSFTATNPEKVARVTNALASGFIEENMRYREERATETSTYTEDELNMAKEILDRKEATMRDYKLKYYNEMPEQQTANMSRLASLQEQYQSRQESIQELERTRVLIRDQIAVRKQMIASAASLSSLTNDHSPPTSPIETEAMQLARLQNNLELLQQRYTDKHPRIKSLKKKIAYLQSQLGTVVTDSSNDTPDTSEEQYDSTLFDLQTEIKGIALSIEQLNKEKIDISKRIQQYEKWIGAAPVREAEWSTLTREYGELRRHYDFLVSQNLQADSALNLERKQKGSQFKIVDPAKTPTKPISPDFLKVMAAAIAAGAALGGGIAFGLNFIDTSFRDPKKLSKTFDLEVICSIPHIALKKERTKAKIITALGSVFFMSWFALLAAALYYFWSKELIVL